MSERQLQKAIMDSARLLGHRVTRMNAGMMAVSSPNGKSRVVRLGEPGTPDLLVRLRDSNCVVWLEVKTPKGRVTALQEAWHNAERKAGGEVHVVRSIDDAIRALKGDSDEE